MIFMDKELIYDIDYLFTCIYNNEPQSLYTKTNENIKSINKEKVVVYLSAHRYLRELDLKPVKCTPSQYTYLLSDIKTYILTHDWKAQLQKSMKEIKDRRYLRNNHVSVSAHQYVIDINSGKSPTGNYFTEEWPLSELETAITKAKELKSQGYQDIMIMISNIGD